MRNLISMTDFVLEDKYAGSPINMNKKYANFLKQPLELWMFVPCDEDGYVLEIDTEHKEDPLSWSPEEIKEYQQAKERCLFDGFTYDGFKYLDGKNYSFRILEIKNMNIENLVAYDLQLTPTAIKQLQL